MRYLKNYFTGHYYKHQKGEHTLCLIAGRSNSEEFIQVITENFSVKVPFSKGNRFSGKGVVLDIHTSGLALTGRIRYQAFSPIRYDIMGPFGLLPMECRHGIISMSHGLKGGVVLNGEKIDFTGGKGYIEMDCGSSFPSSYTWIQANDFQEDASVMAAIAAIPFCGIRFRGCICVIHYLGREYRLATYLGVRVLCCTEHKIVLKQGRYRLAVKIHAQNSRQLCAPQKGEMTRIILEAASCPAEFVFWKGKKKIFHLCSQHASFEYERERC